MMFFDKKRTTNQTEIGFGSKTFIKAGRFINKDGSFNVLQKSNSSPKTDDLYHTLVGVSWKLFFGVALLLYLTTNTIFAFIYQTIGLEHLTGITDGNTFEKFMDAFFFSAQTLTTVGYGRIAPTGILTSTVAAIESMLGLLGFALITGLLYGRFSKPSAKIVFSHNAVIAPYQDKKGFMFRIANKRRNQLIEAEATVVVSMNIFKEDGTHKRIYERLPLELSKINFLALSWTIVHPIDENSPLFNLNTKELKAAEAEFIILVKAFDDTFSQTIYSRTSYKYDEVVVNAKFKSMIGDTENGKAVLDHSKLNEIELVG